MREHEYEPVCGLPEALPPGEEILWQGRPQWRVLARRAFHVRTLAVYLGLMWLARVGLAIGTGEGFGAAFEVLGLAALFAAGLGFFLLLAWLHERTTVYTITNRRVVMRIGVALSATWNLPFARLAAADLALRSETDGDIVLRLLPPDRVQWVYLWPHVAPGRFVDVRPALRGLAEPERVAGLLREAVSGAVPAEDGGLRVAPGALSRAAASPPRAVPPTLASEV
ncbi:MAG: photosynthetic complex putative assembly protein PuhB [Sandaracinaceae bacterium]